MPSTLSLLLALASSCSALHVAPLAPRRGVSSRASVTACDVSDGETKKLTAAEVEEVGNLVADDEWLGLGMELAIVLRSAVRESIKKNVADFTGKDQYKIGDLSKEVDARVKSMVAEYREKDEYELGDLSLALDTMAKEEVNKLTGKDDCATRAREQTPPSGLSCPCECAR